MARDMTPEQIARSISTLTGMVHGLFMTCQAMAKTHPHIDLVLTEIERGDMAGLANLENQPIGDAAIEGYQHVMEALKKQLRR